MTVQCEVVAVGRINLLMSMLNN